MNEYKQSKATRVERDHFFPAFSALLKLAKPNMNEVMCKT
jgi:hypothetical protein